MDDADRIVELEEQAWRALERRLEAARRLVNVDAGSHCRGCGQALPEHRRAVGMCVPCLSSLEARRRK